MRSFLVKNIWLEVVMVGIAISISCSISRQAPKEVTGSPASFPVTHEDSMVAESIFRYQLERIRLRNLTQLYFLSLGDGKDPADEFLKRFDGTPYLVKKYSESVYQNSIVTEKHTGQRGIRLEVKSIKWLSNSEVEVEGSWFAGHENYQEQIFHVYKENGSWSVKSVKGTLDP